MTPCRIVRLARWLVASIFLATALGVAPAASATGTSTTVAGLLSRAGTSNTVYVLASTGCAKSRCVRLYRTTIGATVFTRVTPPPVMGEKYATANSTLERLVFANVDDGYAIVGYRTYGETLYVTTNGARSWRRVDREDQGELEIFVTSSMILESKVHCKPRTMDCAQWVTRRSTLAAKHWVNLPRLWRTGNSQTLTYYGPSLAAYGRDVWELQTGPQQIYLWTSQNRGRTFTRAVGSKLGSVAGCSFTVFSSQSLWAQCPTGMEESFLHSNDGGAQWSDVSQDQFSGTGGGAFAPVSGSVAYLDYGLSIGRRNMFRLTDGGVHARAVAEVKCTDVPSMVFTNTSDGLLLCTQSYSLAATTLRRTNDGGTAWTKVTLPRG